MVFLQRILLQIQEFLVLRTNIIVMEQGRKSLKNQDFLLYI